jgi:L-seryl-tRNA(Ser) seleniumtransferase
MDMQSSLKRLPSVEKVLEDARIAGRISLLSRKGITRIVRESIDHRREILLKASTTRVSEEELLADVAGEVAAEIERISRVAQRRVINATGVVLHTNLERARRSTRRRAATLISRSILRAERGRSAVSGPRGCSRSSRERRMRSL